MPDLPEGVQKKRDDYLARAEEAEHFAASFTSPGWERLAEAYRDLARQVEQLKAAG